MIKYCDEQIKGLEDKIEQIIESDPVAAKNNKLLQSIVRIVHVTAVFLIATTNNFQSFTQMIGKIVKKMERKNNHHIK